MMCAFIKHKLSNIFNCIKTTFYIDLWLNTSMLIQDLTITYNYKFSIFKYDKLKKYSIQKYKKITILC